MQIPYRKPGQFSNTTPDPQITRDKFNELQSKLNHLKKIRPQAAADVATLAELGDFSENAEYQMAKGRLRGINNNILRLEHQINQAQVIEPPQHTSAVALGHKVTIEHNGDKKTYLILGSAETSPEAGIISHHSPIGAALLDRQVGDKVKIKLANREMEYKIIAIE